MDIPLPVGFEKNIKGKVAEQLRQRVGKQAKEEKIAHIAAHSSQLDTLLGY